MKAEELKQKAYRKISNYVGGFWVEYHFNEKELQLYVNEQSGEEMIEFALFAIYEYNAGNNVRSADIKNLYDYWKSNQEEQQ